MRTVPSKQSDMQHGSKPEGTGLQPLKKQKPDACTDNVVGAILSGWRYDISGVPADLRRDYEAHLHACGYCRRRQRLHRTVGLLLLGTAEGR